MSPSWPLDLHKKIFQGFSADELEMLAEYGSQSVGEAFSFFWTTEVYSFGKCYRNWLNWPKWVPIPVYGDHGVHESAQMSNHEISNKARVHLSWNKKRVELNNKIPGKTIIYITHPWIIYRRSKGIIRNSESKGTLIFYSHSIDGIDIEEYKWEKYFQELERLPNQYQPLVVCMHMHDIRKGYHKKICKHNIPIVTLGNASSVNFVDRFYDLVTQFNYATSNTGGSELFYCTELGIPYFLFGEEPIYINHSHSELPRGKVELVDSVGLENNKKKKKLFQEFPPIINDQKMEFTKEMLGLDSTVTAKCLRNIFITELIGLFPIYVKDVLLKKALTKSLEGLKIFSK